MSIKSECCSRDARCLAPPHPDLQAKLKARMAAAAATKAGEIPLHVGLRVERNAPGLNDGLIIPGSYSLPGTPLRSARRQAADRAPLRGSVRVIVVLVDFPDRPMAQNVQHFRDLFFSQGLVPTGSVRDYFNETSHGLIDIVGDVVGPFRMPQALATYAHGASGTGAAFPNARTMARDAFDAANPAVDFGPYDNDGNGFVDAFIVIHAGAGAEVTGSANDIWSHKWVLPAEANADGTKVFAYLTVPEDARAGVCCHELGHLLFGWPDLYDTDGSSEGLGNWCLMAGGSWNGGGDTPAHPSAWCKAQQGWVSVDNRTTNATVTLNAVDTSHTVLRLWKDGAPGSEYFLVENRRQRGFDARLPAEGMLIFHVDETIGGNSNEAHPKVALLQADGLNQLASGANRGDGGDCFPGAANNRSFTSTTAPHSKSYASVDTCVSVTSISNAGDSMTARVSVRCKVKEGKEFKEVKDKLEKERTKEFKERIKEQFKDGKELKERIKEHLGEKSSKSEKDKLEHEKSFGEKGARKEVEKPITDKATGFDKGFDKQGEDFRFRFDFDGTQLPEGMAEQAQGEGCCDDVRDRLTALEHAMQGATAATPFIGQELRPDLRQGALRDEEDLQGIQTEMRRGGARAKQLFDTKARES